jgi:hypothetical protein
MGFLPKRICFSAKKYLPTKIPCAFSKLQQLWLVYMISPGTPSLRVRFLPSSTPALKVLRIGQCNNDDVPFVQSALTEWHEFNKLHQLRELYVCQGGNISAQQWHQFSTSAQNLTPLSFLLCGTIDDAALANIARNCRQIKVAISRFSLRSSAAFSDPHISFVCRNCE